MSERWPITWWENTGKMTPFVGGIASPIFRNLKTGEESSDLPFGACYDGNNNKSGYVYPFSGADG